jgi:quinol monooxygenase YgiN
MTEPNEQRNEHHEHLDLTSVQRAVEAFKALSLGPAETLIAASQIAFLAAHQFREKAKDYRRQLGNEAAREIAVNEIAEAIARLQDASAPAVHGYNDLLRDPDDDHVIPFG